MNAIRGLVTGCKCKEKSAACECHGHCTCRSAKCKCPDCPGKGVAVARNKASRASHSTDGSRPSAEVQPHERAVRADALDAHGEHRVHDDSDAVHHHSTEKQPSRVTSAVQNARRRMSRGSSAGAPAARSPSQEMAEAHRTNNVDAGVHSAHPPPGPQPEHAGLREIADDVHDSTTRGYEHAHGN
ncbi:hypothetical protein Q8F55_004537 [Vanrija albida]|uniref:CRC domain-containing protein n=1 Tax=Vanrija albida TaxID=181172 RepID=A0ABR3Q723_9TREE